MARHGVVEARIEMLLPDRDGLDEMGVGIDDAHRLHAGFLLTLL
jgi:hypothetical protein